MGPLIDFGSDLGAISVDFGWILDGFWKDFWKIFRSLLEGFKAQAMIRATKGKSIDR